LKLQNIRDKRAATSLCERIYQISFATPIFPKTELENKDKSLSASNLGSIIDDLSSEEILKISGEEIDVRNRLALAEILMKAGRSADTLSELLSWKEFEQFCRNVLEANRFEVRSNVRFTISKKRYEIDLVAAKWPHLLFIDCKHWRPKGRSGYVKAALKQRIRMNAALKKESVIGIRTKVSLSSFQRLSLIVSLADVTTLSLEETPVVPIFKFNSFLNGLDQFYDDMADATREGSVLENWIDT
jgi:restriction endonuclease